MNVEVNYVAVLLAAIAFMVVGFLWYSPILFAKPWMKLMGYTAEGMKEMQKKMGPLYGLSFVAALLTAYVLSHTIFLSENFFHYGRMTAGLTSAFFVWLGYVMTTQLTDVIFANKSWKLFVINTGYQLVGLLVMGLIIGLM